MINNAQWQISPIPPRLLLAYLLPLTLICTVIFPSYALGAKIEAYVDRNKVRMGDIIEYTVEYNQKTNTRLRFKALREQFDIIKGPRVVNNTSTINGSRSIYTRWTLEITPKYSGALVIPSVEIDNQRTIPIAITVEKPTVAQNRTTADKPVFIRTEVNKREAYIQEQVILTVRIYHRVEVEGKIVDPKFNNAVVEPLGDKKEFRTSIEGVRYRVKEWKYAVFPQQSGDFIIEPYALQGTAVVGRSGFYLNQNTKRINEKSAPIEIFVSDKPENYPDTQWLPAGQVDIEESWSVMPPKFKVGDPITRTIIVKASQQKGANLPSQPAISSKFFKIYPDQAKSSDEIDRNLGLSTVKTESMAIVPTKSGEFRLPAVKIYWWNTAADKLEVATIPERVINVEVNPEQARIAPPAPPTPDQNLNQSPGQNQIDGVAPVWKAIALGMFVLWLLTAGYAAYLYKKFGDKPKSKKIVVRKRNNNFQDLSKNVKKACSNNDPEDAKYSLIEWGSAYFNKRIVSLGDLERSCPSPDLKKAIQGLQNALYGEIETEWQGDALASAIDNIKPQTKNNNRNSAISELYPRRA